MGTGHSAGRRVAFAIAGLWAVACVFPEYDNDRTGGLAGASGSDRAGSAGAASGMATGGSNNGGDAAAVAGTTPSGGTNGGAAAGGTAPTSGGDDTAAGGATPTLGGAGGEGLSGAGGECGGLACEPATCNDGIKNGGEAFEDCGDSAGECGDCAFSISKFVIGSGEGFSGSAIVTWNDQGMVFDFTVVDATPRNDSSEPWNDDAVEVFLDLNGAKSATYQGDDFQIIVPRDESATHSPQPSANTAAMPVVERSSNAAGYKVKISVPWSTIGVAGDPPLGADIGFDLAVDNDSDGGGRDAQVVIFGTADNFFDTSPWGEITLN